MGGINRVNNQETNQKGIKVAALAGGVGGAKLANGLAQILPPGNLTIIVNIGDDFEHFGLWISPDLDTVLYSLAGLANPATGWGRAGESWTTINEVEKLGGPGWFRLGDLDLAVHLERTRRMRLGESLTQVTAHFCQAMAVRHRILPASNDQIPTIVHTSDGPLNFQDYFVRQRCEPASTGFEFQGVESARPAPGVLEALQEADLVVICPSNPWVSIDPILAVPGIYEAVCSCPVIAVSPIISGKVVKGPAAKMFLEMGIDPSALEVARHYGARSSGGLLSAFIMEDLDAGLVPAVESLGMRVLASKTLMNDSSDRKHLAEEVLRFGMSPPARSVL
jgi:LPPG:FO 2-phospho-L-lactate transferase